MTNDDKGAATMLPGRMHILFENGLFLGAFRNRDAAVRLQNARLAAGKTRPELVSYQRIDDCESRVPDSLWTLYDTNRNKIWGGEFNSAGAARRWRNNAKLPVTIVPMQVAEAQAREERDARAE